MIKTYLESIEKEPAELDTERHERLLSEIASFVASELKRGNRPKLHFICTHNSRRSQLAQAWCAFVQDWMNLDLADCYSGGTEVTACNERTVAALERAGCNINIESDSFENPVFRITASDSDTSVRLWSKMYHDESNPEENFAAVMTCDHADANCPYIPGAMQRFPLTYTDPKYADNTDSEQAAYDKTCRMIAADMIRLFRKADALTQEHISH
ncbi:protein-tyrosine-phosphatase [Rhodohalobacter mucosus]|uniref:Protein-tyrosine-phosphatase n=1 Tax=Rhodohalobacter mucosus TaxID=2079485 RepID=A0A316TVV8_9BACT|nr:protein-tyrosine-phosphatase [Rhodohalobacter mucosus]PWN06654.1 protein-tyrosine-phosphatase [Rhodohalobacter mucosus]